MAPLGQVIRTQLNSLFLIQSLGFPEEALNQNEFSFSTDQKAAETEIREASS